MPYDRLDGILGLQVLFGHMLSDSVVGMYMDALKDLSDEQIERAVRYQIANFEPTSAKPFPVPADFFKAIGNSEPDMAQEAIRRLRKATQDHGAYKSVSFGDPALHATIERFGGWCAVCRWSDDDWKINTKSFIAGYQSAVRNHTKGPKYLAGITEIENTGLYESFIPDVVCIGNDDLKRLENKSVSKLDKDSFVREIVEGVAGKMSN